MVNLKFSSASPFLLFLILLALASGHVVRGLGTVNVWTDSATYLVGDAVSVSFDIGGGRIVGTARIDVTGPVALRWGPFNLAAGGVYTTKLLGATPVPGYYYVKVTLDLPDDLYEGAAAYQVAKAVPFDYSLMVSPARLTVEKGEAATYDLTVKYSHPSYDGTEIHVDASGLAPGMTYTISKDLVLSIQTANTTPSGTYTITLTGSARGITRITTATLVVEEPKAVLTYLSVSGGPVDGNAIYVGQNSRTIAEILNSGNAMARDVRVALEDIAPTSGVIVTSMDPSQDIAPLKTGQWRIDVRGQLPGSYRGVLSVYMGNDRVLESDWKLDVKSPEISVSAGGPSEPGPVYRGDTFTATYALRNTSPVDANVSIDIFVHGLTILQKPSITLVRSQSEVDAQIKLRSDVAGTAWLKVIVLSYGNVIHEDTLDIKVIERPVWEQQPFLFVVAAGAVLVAIVVIDLRQRHKNDSDSIWPHQTR
jgi:hypothetical protein